MSVQSNGVSRLHHSGRVSLSLQPALHLLGYELYVASVKKEALSELTHSLLQVLLQLFGREVEARRNRFFSYTETTTDYSIVADSELILALKSGGAGVHVDVADSQWRPLVVEIGALGALDGISKIAASVIAPLANQNVSVFCLSTNQDDYVLVKEEQLEEALGCLAQRFRLICDSEQPMDKVRVDSVVKRVNHSDLASKLNVPCPSRPITHPYSSSNTPYTICSVVPKALPCIAGTLLGLMFFRARLADDAFFSLTIVEEDISIVMDSRQLQRFPDDALYCSEGVWRLLTIGGGPLGFDECGIVAQVSTPLAQAEISTYYISTFYTDHTLLLVNYTDWLRAFQRACHGGTIPSDSVEKALAVLNANKCSRLCGEGEKLSSLGRPLTVITSGSLR
ncbi:hypothetical protein EMCRGX_G024386 [Ephydatia muelleri]|eukprot:Em0015g570a